LGYFCALDRSARTQLREVTSAGSPESDVERARGEGLAAISNGIVRLFRQYYGRGPTRAKSHLLEDRYVVTILGDTMTTVERTLAERGELELVRQVRLTFQTAMGDAFKGVVEEALGRRVLSYHSQILPDVDVAFEFFLLGER
jgi:uncharacterized protein YbcI